MFGNSTKALAVALKQAMAPEFKTYTQQVGKNSFPMFSYIYIYYGDLMG